MAEMGRNRDYDSRERGWTEDIDRNRDYDRVRGRHDRGSSRDESMFGSSWRDRDDQERERGGWGSLWSPSDDRSERDGSMRGRGSSWSDDDRSRSRAWSHDDDRIGRSSSDDDRGLRSRRFDETHRTRGRADDRAAERDRGYGSDDYRSGLPIEETERLIASNKVEGTAVYGLDGDRLGSVYNFMVDKYSGKVEYAVMTSGGFLGMGTRYFPVPWRMLKYDVRKGGYRVELTARDMERAPSFDRNNEPSFNRDYGERVHNWYGLSY